MKLVTAILAIATLALAGCGVLKNNSKTVYITVGAVLEAADQAMTKWADYVVAEERRIDALPKVDQMAPKAELLRKEGKVLDAYGKYQKAMLGAKVALKAALANPKDAQAPTEVVAALKELAIATAQ